MADLDEAPQIVRRRGGFFVTGESWSGPWATEEAAALAQRGDYDAAHEADRRARRR